MDRPAQFARWLLDPGWPGESQLPALLRQAQERRYILHVSATVRTAWEQSCIAMGDVPVLCRPYGPKGRRFEVYIPLFRVGRRIQESRRDWPRTFFEFIGAGHNNWFVDPDRLGARGMLTERISELCYLIDYLEEFTEWAGPTS